MSSTGDGVVAEARMMCCASCGIAELDDVKLKPCDGCDLISYCSDACKEDHRPMHEATCQERAAKLRDELLFKQPESHISVIVRYVACLFRLIMESCCIHVAVNTSVQDANMPILYAKSRRGSGLNVHSVEPLCKPNPPGNK